MIFLLLLLLPSAQAEPSPIEPACEWPQLTWDGPAELLVQGTDQTFGWLHAGNGVGAAGALGFDSSGAARFRGRFDGQGLTVQADVLGDGYSALTLAQGPVESGPALIAQGAVLHSLGPAPGGVRVGPASDAAGLFRGPAVQIELRCHEIAVGAWFAALSEAGLLSAVGLPGALDERALAVGRRAVLYDEPGGRRLGALRLGRNADPLQVLEERSGWTRVALPHWSGTVWHGWTKARLGGPPEVGWGGLGARMDTAQPVLRACPDEQPLFGGRHLEPVEVGRVAAGVPFELLETRDGYSAVRFPGSWLQAWEGNALLLPAAAAACPPLEPAS